MKNYLQTGPAAFFELALKICLQETGHLPRSSSQPEILGSIHQNTDATIRKLAASAGIIYGGLCIVRSYAACKRQGRCLIPPRPSSLSDSSRPTPHTNDIDADAKEVLKLVSAQYSRLAGHLKTLPAPLATACKHALSPLRPVPPYLKRLGRVPVEHYRDPEQVLHMWWLIRYRL